ncbi:MAG: hypothetical protein Q4E01_00680 [Actinomycetaceae bacterium]|nr:hypothetical protein [Actinomycetaceae bacterium]
MSDPRPFSGVDRWRRVARSMRESLPVNKFDSVQRVGRKMPAIHNPVLIGGLGVAAVGAGAAVKYLKPMAASRQDKQLREMLAEKLARVPGLSEVEVETKQAFGKPLLVRTQVSLSEMPVSPTDLLDRTARYLWDGAPKSPVALQVSLSGPGERWTLVDLDFPDEVARPHELFERFGAPASDPTWKP